MKWQEIRKIYPATWLLIEAIEAHTEGDKRVLDQISVIDHFADGQAAWLAYTQAHREKPDREMFVFHTNRPELDITDRRGYMKLDDLKKLEKGSKEYELLDARFSVDEFDDRLDLYISAYLTYTILKKRFGAPFCKEYGNAEATCTYLIGTEKTSFLVEIATEAHAHGGFPTENIFVAEEKAYTTCWLWYTSDNESVALSEAQQFKELLLMEAEEFTKKNYSGPIGRIHKNAQKKFVENPFHLYLSDAKQLLRLALEANYGKEHLCRAAFFMFMASVEGFLNLIYELYLDDELRDERIESRLQRLDIDVKLRLAPRFCICFENTLVDKGEEFKRFKSLVDLRNNYIHANLVETMYYALHEEDGLKFLVGKEHIIANEYGLPKNTARLKVKHLEFVQETVEALIQKVLDSMKPLYKPEVGGLLEQYMVPVALRGKAEPK